METDYGKLGASFLHIVNRLDLEIKQYFRKLQEMKTETKCHCEIFTLVSNDGIRQKCLCSYLNPERLRTFYSSIFFNRDILLAFMLGIMLDYIIGDPKWLPHPVQGIGYLISFLEKKCAFSYLMVFKI